MGVHYGQLSKEDIIRELTNKKLVIVPTNKKNDKKIKTASFDISPSCLIMSVKHGRFVRIFSNMNRCEKGYRNPEWHCNACRKKADREGVTLTGCMEQKYVYIEPRDTVLVLSKEYLQLPNYICGNVFSRVSTVSSGLGHISTTIDPMWRGALLIAISNPSSEPIKLRIQNSDGSSLPLATVTLQYLNTPAKEQQTTHLPARVDILERYLYNTDESRSRWLFLKQNLSRFLFMNDHSLTVSLIEQLKKMTNISPTEWPKKLSELEKQVCAQKLRGKKWRTYLLNAIPVLRAVLITGAMFVVVLALYRLLVLENETDLTSFIGSLLLALLQCILGMLLK